MSNQKSSVTKYIMVGLLLIAVAGFIITSIPFGSQPAPSNIEVGGSEPRNIKFEKEGTIGIFKMSGEKITSLEVEIAETDEERRQGLMYRQSMGGDQGMLFVFDQEKPQSFWMKNTYIPLDIIFINKDFRIVDQYLGAEPKSPKSIQSRRACTYVLEVNSGFCRAYNIGPGMMVEFERL